MKLVTFSIATQLGHISRIGALANGRAIDLAAVYADLLFKEGVYAAQELAQAIIPQDMAEFLSRWPLARGAAERALTAATAFSDNATTSLGARASYGESEYRLRIPLRPRRLKDYLVYEGHKKKAMERRSQQMPELWYRMPTYTNRNVCGLADPGQDIICLLYTSPSPRD